MATIEASASGISGSFSGSPADNTAAFTKGFEASKCTSLKEMVNELGMVTSSDFTLECRYTNPDEITPPLPDRIPLSGLMVVERASRHRTKSARGEDYINRCYSQTANRFLKMVLGKASLTAIVSTAILASTVKGHGYMSVPKVEFTFNGDTTQYMATIDSSTSGFTGNFGQSPTDNTANFNKGFAASKYSSLKEFMTDKMVLVSKDFTKECGYTNPDETPQPVPETYVEWSHGSGEGFTSSHEGPCEVWCDDTRVFKDDNCPKNFPTAPAKLPYDHDACLGSSRLTIYWIALHSPSWQVYINCAALEKTTSTGAKSKFAVGGSSGGTSTTPTTDSSSSEQTTDASSSTEQTTDAPATPTTDTPTVTEAPSTPSSPATEAPSTPSSPATEAPAPTEAPATESPVVTPAANTGASQTSDTSKCSVRRRRRN
ncbi:hypothetical protein JG687_00013365 [Phytophthora cactorum]|uniref:Uncharacterized protein n=1 Tax=Phytophthora cactorum TaxID=29920 RepID=A0A8T1U235_9STRA|nr:hypothetical protein JG687_00013365 [Phytophthora cactorum]